MEYISAKEFLKQPKEVQEVFLDWWKPSEGDIYSLKRIGGIGVANGNINEGFKNECIPLFTEGQLRKFTEDKTSHRIELLIDEETDQYMISATDYQLKDEFILFDELGINVLQAYWKVACEIVKEELNHD